VLYPSRLAGIDQVEEVGRGLEAHESLAQEFHGKDRRWEAAAGRNEVGLRRHPGAQTPLPPPPRQFGTESRGKPSTRTLPQQQLELCTVRTQNP